MSGYGGGGGGWGSYGGGEGKGGGGAGAGGGGLYEGRGGRLRSSQSSCSDRGSSSAAMRNIEQRLTCPICAEDMNKRVPMGKTTLLTSSKSYPFPQRPGHGTLGNKCMIKANRFLVNLEDKDLHHYHVRNGLYTFGNPAYDGRNGLYTFGALPFAKEFVIKLDEKDGRPSRKGELEFKVAIKFASRAERQFLLRKQKDQPQDVIQFLDNGVRESPMQKFPTDDQGTRMSVVQFSKNKYQCRLHYINLPCLQAGSDAKPEIPMEVCTIVEGQNYFKLDEKQVTVLLRAACERPADREANIIGESFLKKIGNRHALREFFRIVSTKCSYNIFGAVNVLCILSDLSRTSGENKHLDASSINHLMTITTVFPSLLRGSEEHLQALLVENNHSKEKLLQILAKTGLHPSIKLSDIYPALERVCLEGTRVQTKDAVSAIAAINGTSDPLVLSDLYEIYGLKALVKSFVPHQGTHVRHQIRELFHMLLKILPHGVVSDDIISSRTYCAEIAHNVSTRKRKDIAERAAQLDAVVTNKLARVRSQEDE